MLVLKIPGSHPRVELVPGKVSSYVGSPSCEEPGDAISRRSKKVRRWLPKGGRDENFKGLHLGGCREKNQKHVVQHKKSSGTLVEYEGKWQKTPGRGSLETRRGVLEKLSLNQGEKGGRSRPLV